MTDDVKWHWKALLAVCILVGFSLRMYHLGQQLLSWDEGWSIGLSSLDWAAINRITALDVHPPLYYDVFKLWLALGQNELLLRFLSVIAGMLIVPLAYVTGRVWRDERTGILAACIVTVSPLLVYYSQVARMYTLCTALTLLAAYCLLSATERSTLQGGLLLAFVLSAVAALYTFYYTAFAIAAVFIYALLTRPRHWLAFLLSAIAIVLLYAPWLVYAIPPMLSRVGTRTGFALGMADAMRFIADGVFGLVFAYGAGWISVYIVLALLAAGLVLAWHRRDSVRLLIFPFLAITLTLLAVSIGAKVHMFAARYLIPASPFLALLTAWALAACWQRARWLGWIGLLALALSTVPTLTRYVYSKSYEVSGAFDPQADYRYLRDKASADDIVFFNVLSLAGLYERYRTASDPRWSYALRWDPVIEPLETALADRIKPAASQHRRLWFVLYKGTVAANLALKEWLDLNLFPAFGQWREDTLYEQYLSPTPEMLRIEPGLAFGNRIVLQAAEFTPLAFAGDRVVVRLTWTAREPIAQNYKVFVHLYAADGRLVTQHDAIPVNELRPTMGWHPGEQITDNHGLWLPTDAAGPLRLVVGLYDPDSNTRLKSADGSDHVDIGVVEVTPKAH
jgi:hypothetical protein